MANRYDRRYDEHRPPQEGIEKEIMKILEAGPPSPRALVNALVGKGYDDTSVRKHAWKLMDRGWISLDREMRLVANKEPIESII